MDINGVPVDNNPIVRRVIQVTCDVAGGPVAGLRILDLACAHGAYALEMAARGGVGVEIDIALVPTREPGMSPYEVLLSESQERMLVVARQDRVEQVRAIAARWELTATPIGRVTDDGLYRVRHGSWVVVEIPGAPLVEDCPVYRPDASEDPAVAQLRSRRPATAAPDLAEAWRRLLDAPSIASKQWVYEQYDSTVQASTIVGPGGDAGGPGRGPCATRAWGSSAAPSSRPAGTA